MLPWLLFLATCRTTYLAQGPQFSVALMLILVAHEMGHFLQARRYGVPASYPFFIPMPVGPIGTMGAVIGMRAHVGDRKALFDIAITGPLAGLVPALVCCVVGLRASTIVDISAQRQALMLGEPLLFQWLSYWVLGPLAANQDVALHAIGFAGWVGIFITALNLIPIGQLDGGHILYSLLRHKAHTVATTLLFTAAGVVILAGYWGWTLMIVLLIVMGPKHPPTANDYVPLGRTRLVLGWLALLFVVVGFTPTPFFVEEW
jgi:membrane-associated protease RseP (regulator of RpoE activity)